LFKINWFEQKKRYVAEENLVIGAISHSSKVQVWRVTVLQLPAWTGNTQTK